MAFYQSEKFFCFKDQFVKLPVEPHSMGIREHHEREDIRHGEYVNRFLFIIFTMSESKSRSTLISLYSDIYHIEYGKNIISIFHAIEISLYSDDTRHAVFRFSLAILGMMKSVFHAITENAIHPKICQCHYITPPIKTR